jgi:Domain of unknown function (DUF1707)/Domain of unknown function (DUF4190)
MTVGPGYGAGVARGQMRASTVDRDRAIELITRAYTEGRLDKDEHDDRVERAMTATTFADLDSVVVDLPGGRPPAPAPLPRTNPLAVTSLVCGVAQIMFGPFATIPAIVCGHIGRSQIRRSGEGGAGIALAGLVLGWTGLVLGLLAIAGIAALAVSAAHGGQIGPPPSIQVQPPG